MARIYGATCDDRDDFAQEAALKACELWARFPDADEAYVFRAMNNAVISVLRKRRTRRHLSVSSAWIDHGISHESGDRDAVFTQHAAAFGETVPDEHPSPLDELLAADELERARTVLAGLPAELRRIFVSATTHGLAQCVRESGKTRRYVVGVVAAAKGQIAAAL